MATRIAARYMSRRFSSGGKILSEEEKAAENVYIKKMEQERLAKAARKGPHPEEKQATATGWSASDAKPGDSYSTSTSNVSKRNFRYYAVRVGVVITFGALGWYLNDSKEKPEEVHN